MPAPLVTKHYRKNMTSSASAPSSGVGERHGQAAARGDLSAARVLVAETGGGSYGNFPPRTGFSEAC